MFDIEFVPLFEIFNELFPPVDICFLGQLHVQHVWIEIIENIHYLLLASPYFNLCAICDIICFPINRELLTLFKKHSSAVLLFKGFSFLAWYFHNLHHLKELFKEWFPVVPDILGGQLHSPDLTSCHHECFHLLILS